MRFDMYCHTKEGSPDGKIAFTGYISLLKEKGYQGMLLTNHNSYQVLCSLELGQVTFIIRLLLALYSRKFR